MNNRVDIMLATLDDVRGIVDIYCSSVERWIRYVNGKEVEVDYEDLIVVGDGLMEVHG